MVTRRTAAQLASWLLAVAVGCVAHDAAAQNLLNPFPSDPDERYVRFHWSDVNGPVLIGGVVGAAAGVAISARSQSHWEYPVPVIGALGGAAAGMLAVLIYSETTRQERIRKTPPVDLGMRVPNDGPVQLTIRTSF